MAIAVDRGDLQLRIRHIVLRMIEGILNRGSLEPQWLPPLNLSALPCFVSFPTAVPFTV